ncbi:MAG TPA: HD domain-containing phosphohydrolase [Verrucomicrobiae bacterium]|nr:HD domain-containing phosphohydrolase [Verrucomicrobiae bacterium]
MTSKILFVDDEPNVLEAYQRNLRKRYAMDTATGGELALKMMSDRGPYAVIVADMQMPGMNGVEFLVQAQRLAPDSVRLMLTGNADQKTAVEAVNNGHVYQFLNKPCPPEMLAMALENAVRQYRLVTAERELLEKTLNGSINVLTGILASAEPHSFGRGEKLRDYMRAFARSLNLNQTWELELAAMLSQIGYVTIPPKVLEKIRVGTDLTPAERNVVVRVPEIGANLLRNIPRLESVARIVLYQAKNFDGSGFPEDSVAGDQIPIGSRILKVLSDMARLEASGMTKAKALEELQSRTGCYDPQVLDSTFVCFDIYLSAPTSAKTGTRAVALKELAIGDMLSSNIETLDGVRIVCAGTSITQMALEKLRNFAQIQGIKEPIHIQTQEHEA